jgi:hypothetical protein
MFGSMLRRLLLLLLLLVVAGAVVVALRAGREREPAAPPAAGAPPERAQAPPAPAPPGAPAKAPPARSDVEGLESAWEKVDLEEVRRALPENTFWEMSAPTQDERILRDRQEERERWNVEYGKVLSGTASEEEIRAYYAHRQRLSADYVEFTGYVLDRYRSKLSEQDVTLLELARTLHLKRLEGYPQELQRGFDRKREQDAAKERWQADEADFGADAESAEK